MLTNNKNYRNEPKVLSNVFMNRLRSIRVYFTYDTNVAYLFKQ